MKRNIIVLASTSIMTLSLLAGCGGRSKSGKLVIWHDKEEAIVNVLEEAVHEKLPDLEFEFIRKENLTETLKLVGNDPSSAPDMYIFAHDKIGLYDTIGILEPMENIIAVVLHL